MDCVIFYHIPKGQLESHIFRFGVFFFRDISGTKGIKGVRRVGDMG